MIYFRILILAIFFFITACNKEKNYYDFINKYDNCDFSEFNNTFIVYRGTNDNKEVYHVSRMENDEPSYIVYYDSFSEKVKSIDDSNLKKMNIKPYYSKEKIDEIFHDFSKYDFYIIGCDNDNNVLINPYEANTPPYFLRLNEKSEKKYIKKGYVYQHLKGKWYINTIY